MSSQRNSFRLFQRKLQNLNKLSLIDCRIHSVSDFVSSDRIKTFAKKPIHLIIENINILVNSLINDNELLVLIRLFENLAKIEVKFTNCLNFEKLLEQLKPSVNYILVFSIEQVIAQPTPNTLFANRSSLRSLCIHGYIAPKETIRTIIRSLNLKKFWFTSHQLSSNLMQEMAKKQKQLKVLFIYWSHFIEYKGLERNVVFKNVRYFRLQNPRLNTSYFKQIVGMFPIIERFHFNPLNSIRCLVNEEDLQCDVCCLKTFELIPRLQYLRRFRTVFHFIGRQLFQCLERFPNFSHLEIHCMKDIPHDQDYSYNTGKLKDTLDFLFRICKEKPQKVIKFTLECDKISFPSNFKTPRNFKIIK